MITKTYKISSQILIAYFLCSCYVSKIRDLMCQQLSFVYLMLSPNFCLKQLYTEEKNRKLNLVFSV
jgi:hypothetical protein